MIPLIAALLSCPALIQAPKPAEHPVLALDRALNQLYQKRDAEAAGGFLVDAFALYAGGPAVDKANFLSRVKDPQMVMTLIETSGAQVHAYGDTAVLAGELHQKGSFRGKPFDMRMKVTYTWVRVGETWKVLVEHLAPLPEMAQTPPLPVTKKK